MDHKKALENWINDFVGLYNISDKSDIKAELFSGIKPTSYHVPQIMNYLNYPPYSNRGEEISYSWFVEVFIDGLCVARKSRIIENPEETQQLEEGLLIEITQLLILGGIGSCYRTMKEYYEQRKF